MKTTTKTRLDWCWGDFWGGDDTDKSADPESAHDKVEQVRLLGKGLSYLTRQNSSLLFPLLRWFRSHGQHGYCGMTAGSCSIIIKKNTYNIIYNLLILLTNTFENT